jgi:hypothetical protein
MADEARVRSGFTIQNGGLVRRNPTASFTVDVDGENGPSPGAVTVATTGTDIDFSQLITPGLCQLSNLDVTNYYEYGIHEPVTGTFYPLGEVGPGESYCIKFSRNLLEEYVGTGTSGPTNTFQLRANTAAVVAVVEAYEK